MLFLRGRSINEIKTSGAKLAMRELKNLSLAPASHLNGLTVSRLSSDGIKANAGLKKNRGG